MLGSSMHAEIVSFLENLQSQQGELANTVKSISGQVTGLTMQLARVHSEIRGEVLGNAKQAVSKFTEINDATALLVENIATVKKELQEHNSKTSQDISAMREDIGNMRDDIRSNSEAIHHLAQLGSLSADTGATVLAPSTTTTGRNSPEEPSNAPTVTLSVPKLTTLSVPVQNMARSLSESPRVNDGEIRSARRRAQFSVPNFGADERDEQVQGREFGSTSSIATAEPQPPPNEQSSPKVRKRDATRGGDPKEFLNAVKKGGSADCVAILDGSDEAAIVLNEVDADGRTPLHWAATSGLTDVLRRILAHEKFQLVNATDKWGKTALHWAAACSHAEVCRLLLHHHPFTAVNTVDCWGQTCLHWAASGGLAEVCRQLIMRKDFTMKDAMDNLGRTAAQCAQEASFDQVVRILGVPSEAPSAGRSGQKAVNASSASTPTRARQRPAANPASGTPTTSTAPATPDIGKAASSRGRGGAASVSTPSSNASRSRPGPGAGSRGPQSVQKVTSDPGPPSKMLGASRMIGGERV